METYNTSPCISEGPILYDPDHLNNHSNKINLEHLRETYRKDEVIVYLDKSDPKRSIEDKINEIKETFCKKGIPIESIKVRKCDNCDIQMVLMSAPGIDTIISSGSVQGGSGGKTGTVGESYSLNFLSQIPHLSWKQLNRDQKDSGIKDYNKEKVTIAVLDTGIDTCLVNPAFVCEDFTPKKSMPCYNEVKKGGRNFIDNEDPDNYFDDNKGKHGSLVSQYIINQFTESCMNRVKIMPLKTHDENGVGDLFNIICAIYFAMAKGANIINASWGFYYYYDDSHLQYFRNLIENELREAGILFVTAAGNRIPKDDQLAENIFSSQNGGALLSANDLRDLAIHRFFPAHLSIPENNIVTVTTTDGTEVSPQQNHSDAFVDLGVTADAGPKTDLSFNVPFKLSSGTAHIAGSSFAAAIATGVIGANCSTNLYVPNLKKADFINPTGTIAPHVVPTNPLITNKLIRNGTCIKGV